MKVLFPFFLVIRFFIVSLQLLRRFVSIIICLSFYNLHQEKIEGRSVSSSVCLSFSVQYMYVLERCVCGCVSVIYCNK